MIGYQASHEQFSPSQLLRYVQLAEAAGFTSVNSSDHFFPWSRAQGQSGFAFSWLGAALATTTLSFTSVCAPGQRYHPAIVAQAVATLAELFPGRYDVALGSGEALNERITGAPWPPKAERNVRLGECAAIIRALLQGKEVTHHGTVTVEGARLYTVPAAQPRLFAAALSPETAGIVAAWADGLITVRQEYSRMRAVLDAFRSNGGDGKPACVKVDLSYAATDAAALQGAWEQWRNNIFSGTVLGELSTVAQFDALGDLVQPEEVKEKVLVSSSLEEHADAIASLKELGFERIILHNVNREQERFIEDFAAKVLPQFNARMR
ncbi:TIGR03885 family FMN-dependent LLM class oxidoreductase [Flaviaesturariibacter flavus]|uniref:TIGR03885 family FMN-dependent LLM class oxidoreductase n=1 Tax=Flaviaesturariibacter flavus TaxID=2502780 RepID=A0A4R1BIM6_9BACT|nr:TIGR03885 family FMN-dependent LLM class oxidoreductase [Flaviaesturariibacter flavus]TCJ17057.1 TIGR03885 family FMN-dependent LLM class oxidoreductase [Flaviaesturariibacter flavus]